MLDVLLGEHLGVVLHVLLCVLISAHKLEAESAQEDGAADEEVLLGVVGARDRVLVVATVHELATDAAAILVANLVDEDGVVTAEEGDDELTVLIIRLSRHELGVEAEDVHVLLEHLLHVSLGSLRSEVLNRGHGISLGTEALVVRDGLVLDGGRGSGESHRHLGNAKLLLVPVLGPGVTVVDIAVTAVDLDLLTALNVSRHVVLLLTERHARADGKDGCLGKLLALKKLGERSTARVLGVDLLNLNSVISKEVHESVELVTTVIRVVLPQDGEAEDAAIVIQELLETAVRASTLQLDLDVVLELSLIRRSLLHVDHGAGMLEGILRVVLSGTDIDALVGVVAASEFVTVNDAEDARVDVKVHAEAEIRPVIVTGAVRLEQLRALKENALRDSRVLDAGLNDVEGVIIEVEVDDALPDTVVLRRVLNDGLEEVGLEVEDLQKEYENVSEIMKRTVADLNAMEGTAPPV